MFSKEIATPWLVVVKLAALLACGSVSAQPVTLFVGPDGKSTNSGLSESDPLPDLASAWTQALADKRPVTHLEIRVLPGTYIGQIVRLSADGPMPELVIRREGDERPVFDGAGSPGTWLSISANKYPISRISISGLKVTGYATAISLNGSRNVDQLAVTDVTLRNNIFDTIGQFAPTQDKPSTAAVRLVNADRVQIINNRFVHVRNRQRCPLIHAVYLAHGSTNNLVEGNYFEDGCGDAIRTRDASNNNRIVGNTFVDAWDVTPISDWFCNSSVRKDCTKETPECPSFANEVANNRIEVRRLGRPEIFKTYGPDTTSHCLPADAAIGVKSSRFVSQ
jgi:hypothetical protein